jgi:phosphate starvation-inducible membrane PsiE
MAREPQRVFMRILEAFERIAYLTIAFAFGVPIVMLVISAVMSMLEVAEVGILDTALAVLDSLLLAFIFVELIDTIKIVATGNERGIFMAEPFLLVGLIAVVRSILLLTANLKGGQSMERVQTLLIELVVLTVLVGVLASTLYYARRMRLSEKKRELSE